MNEVARNWRCVVKRVHDQLEKELIIVETQNSKCLLGVKDQKCTNSHPTSMTMHFNLEQQSQQSRKRTSTRLQQPSPSSNPKSLSSKTDTKI